jgi:hypothetical protein
MHIYLCFCNIRPVDDTVLELFPPALMCISDADGLVSQALFFDWITGCFTGFPGYTSFIGSCALVLYVSDILVHSRQSMTPVYGLQRPYGDPESCETPTRLNTM